MNLVIVRKNIKNINITVKADLKVVVSAPNGVSLEYVKGVVDKKMPWIRRKLREMEKSYVAFGKMRYVDGEKHFYLGDEYVLRVVLSDDERVEADKEGGFLHLFVNDPLDEKRKEALMDEWYKEEAGKIFVRLIEKYRGIVGREVKRISIKKMRSRWGSCNHVKGYINLNLHLIKRDIKEIEYVVLHELAHLIHPNHSREFYGYIESIMPDWRERRAKMKKAR